MAKTKPIGVRFDESVLNEARKDNPDLSHQKALNLYEKSFTILSAKIVKENEKNIAEINVEVNDIKGVPPTPITENICDDAPANEDPSQLPIVSVNDDIKAKIIEYENELPNLGKGEIGQNRRKFIEKQIYILQKQLSHA